MSKTKVGVAIIATAAAGSAALSGVALATNVGGPGTGGTATNNCLNVGLDVLSGIGLGGTGVASGASCTATANGTGGGAY
jgi:hypothetical protein